MAKVLYAVQGTGNGHISRARTLIPEIAKHVDLDVAMSGHHYEVDLGRKLNHQFHGLAFSFGKKGGIDFRASFRRLRAIKFATDIRNFPIEKYDYVINDFEPVTAWAAKIRGIPSTSISHQSSFRSAKTPRPKLRNPIAEKVMSEYAPTERAIGFHFEKYDDFILTPIIRSEIREREVKNNGHITVYLPAFDDITLIDTLKHFERFKFEIFSKHTKVAFEIGNIRVSPISNEEYTESLLSSAGLITGGGFESPAEALFLGKKLLVIPMKAQYEQKCNGAALERMGVKVLKEFSLESSDELDEWLCKAKPIKVEFPNVIPEVIGTLLSHMGR